MITKNKMITTIITLFSMSTIHAADNLPHFHTIQGSMSLLAVVEGEKFKLYNHQTGDFVSSVAYDDIYGLYACSIGENDVAVVKSDNKYGLIDVVTGQEIVSPGNSPVTQFEDGIYLARNPLEWVINGKKEQLTAVPVYVDARWGYHAELNPVLYYYSYDRETFEFGNCRMGYCDSSGKEIIPPIYSFAASFIDGTAIVEVNNKYGVIDLSGNQIIPCKYDKIESLQNIFRTAKEINGGTTLYGITDKTGKELIPCKYGYIEPLRNNWYKIAQMINDTTWRFGIMDGHGKKIIPIKYENVDINISADNMSIIFIAINDKVGVISPQGKMIIPSKYESIDLCRGAAGEYDSFIAVQNGKYVRIDLKGKIIAKYDENPCPTITIDESEIKYIDDLYRFF